MLQVAICDDDCIFLDKAEALVQKYNRVGEGGEKMNLAKFQLPEVLLDNVLDGDNYDIFLLDIEMPSIDGITLAHRLREALPHCILIFLTSHEEFHLAQESMKVTPLRYLCKGNMENTLAEALDAARAQKQKIPDKLLVLTHYNDLIRIFHGEILYVHRTNRHLEIHCIGQGPYRDSRGLNELFKNLDNPCFLYIERSCFVNLDHVQRIEDDKIYLTSGDTLFISRRYLPQVKSQILCYWGA